MLQHKAIVYNRGSQLMSGKGQIVLTKMWKGQMLRIGLYLPPRDYESRGLSVLKFETKESFGVGKPKIG